MSAKIILDTGLYCGLIFCLMLLVIFYPGSSDKYMVIMGDKANATSIYGLLKGTDARVVERLSHRRFIIQGEAKKLTNALYKNGAFLVLNAPAVFGCGGSSSEQVDRNMFREGGPAS